jgi:uncharacterized membrane protein YkoI
MRKISLVAGAAIALAAAAALGAGISAAGVVGASGTAAAQDSDGSEGSDGPDTPLTGMDLEKATQAALAHTRGGTVTETEVGDDGAAYSVEIRTSDGRNVEVQLNNDFKVIGEETDD